MKWMNSLVLLVMTRLTLHGQYEDVTAYVTADNYYALYTGQADGSGLQLIGRNERTDSDPNGGFAWSFAETWNFRVGAGEHIYVAAWNSEYPGGYAMWIGAFHYADQLLQSSLGDWECAMSIGPNPNSVGDEFTRNELPSLDALQEEIRRAEWMAPGAALPNGTSPWGMIGLVDNAEFIWYDSLPDSMLNDHFFIFRNRDPIAGPIVTNQAPIVFLEPEGGQFYVGEKLKLSARALGAWPLVYQWWRNDAALPGATSSSLTLSNLTVDLSGDYHAVITNGFGAVTSQVARVTVTMPKPNTPITAGLVGLWEGENRAADTSGMANHGTLVGKVAFAPGVIGQAFDFRGGHKYVRIPDHPSLDGFTQATWSFWVNLPDPTGPLMGFMDKRVDAGINNAYSIFVNDGSQLYGDDFGIELGDASGGWSLQGAAIDKHTLLADTWHHLAVTFNTSAYPNFAFYLDGFPCPLTALGNDLYGPVFDSTADLVIGAFNNGSWGGSVEGLMDHVALYNRALTLPEIETLAAGPVATAPVTVLQPEGGDYVVGEGVRLSVRAQGTAPLRYQWWRNEVALSGAASWSLTLSNLTVAQSGDYYAVVTNAFGAVTSQVAKITVAMPRRVPVPAGLVAWWTGDGNADDLRGVNHGILMNGATFTQGQVGQALWFDGVDDGMWAPTTGLPVGTSDRTMEFWFRVDAIVAGESMWVGYGAVGEWQRVWCVGVVGNPAHVFWSQWGSGVHGPSIELGRWHHLAAASEWGVTTLYLDGVAVASSSLYFDTPPGTELILGYLDEGRKMRGAIDELSIYNRALAAGEIQAIYRARGAGKAKPGSQLEAPVLRGTSVVLSWAGGPGIKLQKATRLIAPDWREVPRSDGASQIELPRADAVAFFRLSRP